MPSIDDRIVRMEFDNAAFERNVNSTIASLAALDKSMKFTEAQKGLSGLSEATSKFDMSHIASSLDNISDKFHTMGAIGFSVIESLTQSALGMAKRLGGDILGPIISGGTERAKNIEQAKFMFQGLGMDVEAGMASALAAVKGTAFGLDEAAKAAAQFGAAGVNTGDDLTAALRGVAGAAAMTGASFKEIAYVYAGSAGSGKVTNMDLLQFATRGLNAAAAVGKVMGKTEAQVHEMATAGTLDFKTFAAAMDTAFGAHATEANRTFSGALSNLHAAMSRLGAAFIAPELTNFRDIFNSLSPVIDKVTTALQPLFSTLNYLSTVITQQLTKSLDGISFDNLTKAMPNIQAGFVNIFKALQSIFIVGKQAFQNIFPPGTESIVVKLSQAFETFTSHLILSWSAASQLRGIFEGIFSALSIGWTVLKEGAKFIFDLGKSLLSLISPAIGGGISKIASGLVDLQKSLVQGGGIKDFFASLTEAMKKPLEYLGKIKNAISDFFSGFNIGASDRISDSFGRMGDRFKSIGDAVQPLKTALGKIMDVLGTIWDEIEKWFSELGKNMAKALNKGDFNAVLDALNTGLLGGIAVILGNWMKKGINIDLGTGMFAKIGQSFDALTGYLKTMQLQVKADIIMKIAEALALLTVSVVALSMIDSAALTKALAAMAVGFGELMGSFALLIKVTDSLKSAGTFIVISTGMIILSAAVLILAAAVKILSTMDWEGLVKGLGGVLVLLAGLSLAVKPLSENSKGMITAGLGIAAIGVGLVIIAGAMKIFATMSWEDMAKGLLGVASGLTAVVLAMNLLPKETSMVKAGLGIMGIATAMLVLAVSVKMFGNMSWGDLAKGLVGFAIALGGIILAVNLMPKDMGKSASGIVMVAGAVLIMAAAIKMLGNMSWENMAKGLLGVAAAMAILVVASMLMEGTLPGAAAMIIMAASLVILADVVKRMADLSWGDMLKGLLGIVLILGIIAAAAWALDATGTVVLILALGAALVILGLGFALIGVGAYLLAQSFETLTNTIVSFGKSLPDVLEAVGRALPELFTGLAKGILDFIKVFVDAAPAIAKMLGVLLNSIIDTLVKIAPKLGKLIGELLDVIITVVREYFPQLVDLGLEMIMSLLQGISENIGPITTAVGDIITNFLTALDEQIPRIAEGVAHTIETAFTSAAEALGEIEGTLLLGVGIAFIDGLITGVTQQLTNLDSLMGGIPGDVLTWIGDTFTTLINKGIDFIRGLITGITNFIGNVISFFQGLPGQIFGWIGNTFNTLISKGTELIAGFAQGVHDRFNSVLAWFGGLADTISGYFSGAAGWLIDAGKSIIEGLGKGIEKAWEGVKSFVGGLKDAIISLKGPPEDDAVLLVNNGMLIMQGLQKGMESEWANVETWLSNVDPAAALDKNLSSNMANVLSNVASQMSDMADFNPVITPVLDLTQVAAEATKIGGYISDQQVSPTYSYGQAQTIARTETAPADISTDTPATTGVNFNQVINSPTQLSESDIYKQTRNLITIAKEELSIP